MTSIEDVELHQAVLEEMDRSGDNYFMVLKRIQRERMKQKEAPEPESTETSETIQ